MKILIYGHNGWISNLMQNYLLINKVNFYVSKIRVDNFQDVCNEIESINPSHLMCFIGRTHGGNINTIDYLENKDKLDINLKDNLYAPFNLVTAVDKYNIHLTYSGTGCIYTYDEYHKIGDLTTGFTEDDIPNFKGSAYSTVKGYTDQIMKYKTNVLNLRIRMPISSESNSRNFINKIINYDKICSIPNSMSVLDDLIPIMLDMATKNTIGTYNFTNPGLITHNEILEMYKEYVDPKFKWSNFTIEEQANILKAERSNNYLDTSKLQILYPKLKNIKECVRNIMINIKKVNNNLL